MKKSASRNALRLGTIFVLLLGLMSIGQAQTAQNALSQYVTELQNNRDDSALRRRIIHVVRTMDSVPVIPEEARRNYAAASALMAGARTIEDLSESIPAYESALLFAPWWPEANRDLGLVLEAARRYDEAITYLELYMATNPGYEELYGAFNAIMRIKTQGKWKKPC
jgi:tetratricopeptide (TPR) repeat protein